MTTFFHSKLTTLVATLIALLSSCFTTDAQNKSTHVRKVVNQKHITETFYVLASDTTVRDGLYTMAYKGRKIEQGKYSKGQKVGPWKYWNYKNLVELVYNYTLDQPTQILPHVGKTYTQDNYPCIFLGSPVIPHLYIMTRIYYPIEEKDNKKGGFVLLSIKVDENGQMYGYKIKEATTENFRKVVKEVADTMPTQNWRWIPEHFNGKPIKGEYDVKIYFDN